MAAYVAALAELLEDAELTDSLQAFLEDSVTTTQQAAAAGPQAAAPAPNQPPGALLVLWATNVGSPERCVMSCQPCQLVCTSSWCQARSHMLRDTCAARC